MSQTTYEISFGYSNPTHYAMVPHIIDHLTYDEIDDEGNITKKRLSVYAKELYRVIIRIAGEDGACWANRDTLAEMCNMSAGAITNAKKELQQKFNETEGTPLILIKECNKSKFIGDKKINTTIYHTVTITDVWKFNGPYMRDRKFLKPETPSPHDKAEGGPSPHDLGPQGAPSPHDTNKNQYNKNHLSNKQQPSGGAEPVCSLDKQPSVFSGSSTPSADKLKAFNHLLSIGFDEKAAILLMNTYSPKEISDTSAYVGKVMKNKKGASFKNILGYFRSVLQNGYYKSKNDTFK